MTPYEMSVLQLLVEMVAYLAAVRLLYVICERRKLRKNEQHRLAYSRWRMNEIRNGRM